MRATTGSTGAPQPTTLQGPVDRPSTLAAAASPPPARPDPARQLLTPAARRSSQSATYTATSTAVTPDPSTHGADGAQELRHGAAHYSRVLTVVGPRVTARGT